MLNQFMVVFVFILLIVLILGVYWLLKWIDLRITYSAISRGFFGKDKKKSDQLIDEIVVKVLEKLGK